MGCIVSIGVAVANAILMLTKANSLRLQNSTQKNIGTLAAQARFRPILMTSATMIAGMVPMAMGWGEGGEQIAPLGIAVIGGLLFSLIASLLVLPLIYNTITNRKIYQNVSLDPDDVSSKYYRNEPNDN